MPDAYAYIRFSTTEQATGDSWRRQNSVIERFIEENKLTLRESEAFQDLGVSSFRGANRRAGLGRFLAEVESGRVKRGSFLIVESIDRLSRQEVFDSLQLLMTLVDRGIEVVTLTDGGVQVLNKSAGFPALVLTLSSMFRAHGESAQKSVRLTEAWEEKRRNAATKIVSKRGPEWLTYSSEAGRFVVNEERAATVKKIFELADSGLGRHRIVKYLNSNGFKSFRNETSGWQPSSVAKLLRSRTVLGAYQPHRLVYDDQTGKRSRVPEGEELANYYPAIVDEGLFSRVFSRQFGSNKPILGRQGESLTNLFTGLVECAECGSRMTLCNKGPRPKGGRYLVCSRAVRGKGCVYRGWPYDRFEMLALSALKEVNLALVMKSVANADLTAARDRIPIAETRLAKLLVTLSNMEASFDAYDGVIPAGLIKRYDEVGKDIEATRTELARLRAEEYTALEQPANPEQHWAALMGLLVVMDVADPQEKYLIRVQLRRELGYLIDRLKVWPAPTRDEHQHFSITCALRNGFTRHVTLDEVGHLHSVDVRGEGDAEEIVVNS